MNRKYTEMRMEEGICTVTLNRPPVNALNNELMAEIESLFSDLALREDLRVVILTGQGEKAFIAGADITEIKDLGRDEGTKLSAGGQAMTNAIQNCPVPVICAINGLALGGGCEVAMACDIRIMVENAVIGLPEAGLGLLPGAGGTQRLPRIVAPGMARLLLFTAAPINAVEALRCGLVEKVVKREALMETALEMAKKIASNGPLGVRAIKVLVQKSSELSLEAGMALEAEEFGKLCATEDKIEGIAAFFEKRKPVFRGK
jgi:enoyl-CoA hydratase